MFILADLKLYYFSNHLIPLDYTKYDIFFFFEGIAFLTITILYAFLIFKRSRIIPSEFDDLDYHKFMNNKKTFILFKKYVTFKNNDEIAKCLSFLFDYTVLKSDLKLKRDMNKSDQEYSFGYSEKLNESIRLKSQKLFNEYINTSFDGSSGTSSLNNKSGFYTIDFPMDIVEKLQAMNKQSFSIDELDSVFDDAFVYVNQKIEEFYKKYIVIQEERIKVQNILFFSDYIEV